MDTIDYLGHVIISGSLEIVHKTTDSIKGQKPPNIVTELKYFLVLWNLFRRFVPNFSRISAPRKKELQKDQTFQYGDLKY